MNLKGRNRSKISVLIALGAVLIGTGNVFAVSANDLPLASYVAAEADGSIQFNESRQVAPGVTYRSFQVVTSHGQVTGNVIEADLTNKNVKLDLLHPDSVAQRELVSRMADEQHAVAGVNGDFFNISETHEGVAPTNSAVGPEIADGIFLKAAVPNGQRFGPGLPSGTSTRDVFAIGYDGRARVTSLEFDGRMQTREGKIELEGLNQYALPVGGIGVYTHDWGSASRIRPTCGTDTKRNDPCSTDTFEVTVRHGIVTSVRNEPGAGSIPEDTVVLVGREDGADELSSLEPGDRVMIQYRPVSEDFPRLKFAVGGFPILRDGQPLAGLDQALAPRTSAGVRADGKHVYLVVVDGRSAASVGMNIGELADLLRSLGASDAVNLDGGGSSALVTRLPGEQHAIVRNTPSDGSERAVANGIGVFVRH